MDPSTSPLRGRVIFVSGATSGIGRETALKLVEAGAYVVASGRDSERSNELADELGASGECIEGNVAQPEDIDRIMKAVSARHRALDGLVINAGVAPQTSLEALDTETYDQLMDVNVKGATFTFARALPLLAEGASCVFVGSVAGRKGQPGDALYAGSKGFVRAFARSVGTSPDVLRRGIRVNVVSPGPTETRLTAQATMDPSVREYVEGLIPMRRWGKASEVADAILFLLSDASSFTTGAEITVDGGMAHA
ncbi:SDR family NAD(P)-dependent oxidoreductase [Paraburkholderia strydomiana]|uniref:SDR family NAD(P)-dependent oxidoreductase n=1 Tax=Paraburkholderia strydomiana TaxID=1245417 RepID=UPI002864C251|nr:SDR family oxidoreductase [Paraburkholderia strydomiana]MDR7009313.1 NAD(P)-dependent dehydrogenase (short-subunit alcohol dehydrogenase family) [Paraburkholderia strydomiana]